MLKNNKLICIGLTCYTLIIFNILQEEHNPNMQVAGCNSQLNKVHLNTFQDNEVNRVYLNEINNLIEIKKVENEKTALRQKEKQTELTVLIQEKANIKLKKMDNIEEEVEVVDDESNIKLSEEPQEESEESHENSTSNTYDISNREREILLRITEAEATGASVEARKNVASVIINRVNSNKFPNSIEGVVFQKGQFSPIQDQRYYNVTVTDKTVQAVDSVLQDGVTNNALFFCNYRDVKSLSTQKWFNKLSYQFKDDSGHSFYK